MIEYPTRKSSESLALDRLAFAERAVAEALNPSMGSEPVSPVPNLASLLLVVSAQSTTLDDGRWQFAIETAGGDPILEAEDHERGDLNRLTLLAAVRGLEAIDGPSGVTLLSHNRYLIRSLTDSLPRWRRSDFVWDHFGRRVEVQHADLWRRIDHALGIHEVQACLLTARMVSRPDVSSSQRLTMPAEKCIQNQPSTDARTAIVCHTPRTRIESAHTAKGSPHTGNRLRDWLLQSAVDTSQRAHRIAMIGQERPK
ncbi:ribonuclease HI [Rhodopirellula rubra]|uniref:Ribonuclease HI n=2 Tax=Aporhodopirellula rubra TaxID=980271 RepID=A0A7W5E1E3_9BACT|nr:ribonuclease HI [Aporhodopirellula rubra]MBB3208032.1 ribonuclease HI [Aporhodopirellula rubra]